MTLITRNFETFASPFLLRSSMLLRKSNASFFLRCIIHFFQICRVSLIKFIKDVKEAY